MSEKDKPKDFWDKIQVGTTFISTVLIGLAGLYFTYSYNQRQLKQTEIQQAGQYKLDSLRLLTQVSQAAVQAQLQQVQLQTAQVQAMTQLVPYLASTNLATKKVPLLSFDPLILLLHSLRWASRLALTKIPVQ